MKARNIHSRKWGIVLLICFIIAQNHFEISAFDNYSEVQLQIEQGNTDGRYIRVNDVHDNTAYVYLYQDNIKRSSIAVGQPIGFEVFQNGIYEIQEVDIQGKIIAKNSVEINDLASYESRDKEDHSFDILSRYPNSHHIRILEDNNKTIAFTEVQPGFFTANYKAKKNENYTIQIETADNLVLQRIKKIVNTNDGSLEKGVIVLHDVDELAEIKNNPKGEYALGNDIEMQENILSDVVFKGKLIGNGYTLSGVQEYLFASIENAQIQLLQLNGKLAKNSINSTIENCGFYIQQKNQEDGALIVNSENTDILNSYVLANMEGNQVAGFVLSGSANITNSYVSGYLKGKEVYGFAKDAVLDNCYISASILGDKRLYFTESEYTNCFYDYQINDITDTNAKAMSTKELTNKNFNNDHFTVEEGYYPKILQVGQFKKKAQDIAKVSVIHIESKENLSALKTSITITKEDNWSLNNVKVQNQQVSLNEKNGEVSVIENEIINRFSLTEVTIPEKVTAGISTSDKTTQIIYPVEMGKYYKVVKEGEDKPTVPTSHEKAIENGWKIVYWSGSQKEMGLAWNSKYHVYKTDLHTVESIGTVKTVMGKSGGELVLSGNFQVGEVMTATLKGTNTTKGELVWQTSSRLDTNSWATVKTTSLKEGELTDTYQITNAQIAQYMRVAFTPDTSTGFKGTLEYTTDSRVAQKITAISIRNPKPQKVGNVTMGDLLVADMSPKDMEQEVNFEWYRENESVPVGTGRQYTVQGSDVGYRLYVKVSAKQNGYLNGTMKSSMTSKVLSTQSPQPIIAPKLIHADDMSITMTMETDAGLYRFGVATSVGGKIKSSDILCRANVHTIITGLQPMNTYYIYVQRVGENGSIDSNWSTVYTKVTTDNTHVQGDVKVSGDEIYGYTLNATVINGMNGQKGQYVWYRLDDSLERIAGSRTVGSVYRLKKEDVGQRIEAVYEGMDGYGGEIAVRTGYIQKEAKEKPIVNLTEVNHTDTTVTVKMPDNTTGEKYIIGQSMTKNGGPIEVLDGQQAKVLAANEEYTITGLQRDTEYYYFVRYASSTTHEKSDWIEVNKAIHIKTNKKTLTGQLKPIYESKNNTLMQGHTLQVRLEPDDEGFNYQGEWIWERHYPNKDVQVINDFTLSDDKRGTQYIVPKTEAIGVTYVVKFKATVGYEGTLDMTSTPVAEVQKEEYDKPNPVDIELETIDDGSISAKMSSGLGLYRFQYKPVDQSPLDSFSGFLKSVFLSDDGYIDINKSVYSNVDVVVNNLDRDKEYTFRVRREEDEGGKASAWTYCSEVNKSIYTAKTAIAGYVSIEGEEEYGTILKAQYHPATYASSGLGSDTNGHWQWYRGNEEIVSATNATYQIQKEDLRASLKVVYKMAEDEPFSGSVEASTKPIRKASSKIPEVSKLESNENKNKGILYLAVESEYSSPRQKVYYRLQPEADGRPLIPEDDNYSLWSEAVNDVYDIEKDANGHALEPSGSYVLYMFKAESDLDQASRMLAKPCKIGTPSQGGTMKYSEDMYVGKTVRVDIENANNDKGTWKWYKSKEKYGIGGLQARPDLDATDQWEELSSGYSPKANAIYSELNVTEELFGHYIYCKFEASKDSGYSSFIQMDEEQLVKKIYNEKLKLTSPKYDGNNVAKAYANTTISAVVENCVTIQGLDRENIELMIGDEIITEGIEIKGNTFTYTIPEKTESKYADKEIIAQISKPKEIELYVDTDLKPLETGIINSKDSTGTSIYYKHGVPIDSAEDLEKFMKAEEPYVDRSSNMVYVISDHINMSQIEQVVYSDKKFEGILDGDYHTIVGTKNPLFLMIWGSYSQFAEVKNIIFYNAKVSVPEGASDINLKSGAVIANTGANVQFTNMMLVDSDLSSAWDTGYLIGRGQGTIYIDNVCSAGGNVKTTAPTTSLGGFVGYFGGGNPRIQNSFSLGVTTSSPERLYGVGGMVGGGYYAEYKNVYVASPLFTNATVVDPLQGGRGFNQLTNAFYDSTIVTEGHVGSPVTPLTTQEIIGENLKEKFESEKKEGEEDTWSYVDGYYPRLKWTENHPIAKLYTATRGAFTSLDGQTSAKEMFEGKISGPIQIPAEFQNENFKVESMDEDVLVVSGGTIIPLQSDKTSGTIKITYTEPNEKIGGTAENYYTFTVVKPSLGVNSIYILNEDNQPITKQPMMGQTLKAEAAKESTYQWYRRKIGSVGMIEIPKATNATYLLQSEDIGFEIAVKAISPTSSNVLSVFTPAIQTATPEKGPKILDVQDTSVRLAPQNGYPLLTYEFGYRQKDDVGTGITIVNDTCTKDETVEIRNLQRNRNYDFYVRVAKGEGYVESDWSPVTSQLLKKTYVQGNVVLGINLNSGTDLSMSIESLNGQTGVWKLEHLKADTDEVVDVISENFATTNSCNYTLSPSDIGHRIRVTYVGNGDFDGEKVAISGVVKKAKANMPQDLVFVKKDDSSITVKMEQEGTYDIAFMETANGSIHPFKTNIKENEEITVPNLKRNTLYYFYVRTSANDNWESSQWKDSITVQTDKSELQGSIDIQSDEVKINNEIHFIAPTTNKQTYRWKLERIRDGKATTIAPGSYQIDTDNRILTYKMVPRDANCTLKVTLTGTNNFINTLEVQSAGVKVDEQSSTDIPLNVKVTNITDNRLDVTPIQGEDIYEFAYIEVGKNHDMVLAQGSVGKGKALTISNLKRNTGYDIYIRKAAKTGYEPSQFVKITNVKTAKSTLNGHVKYIELDANGNMYPVKVGEANIGHTYVASYEPGVYVQPGDDSTIGYWQWYADGKAISNANSNQYTVEPTESKAEITVRYHASDNSDYTQSRMASIGTIQKIAYKVPDTPVVRALAEDGEQGSKLQITTTDSEDVFYYIQKAQNTLIPKPVLSVEAKNNVPGVDHWFKAEPNMTLTLEADEEYIVYAARLESSLYGESGIISLRAVKMVKDDLSKIQGIKIEEIDTTSWKALQSKGLQIKMQTTAPKGRWQYYVSSTPEKETSWQNITNILKGLVTEEESDKIASTQVTIPMRFSGQYYVKATFTGQDQYEGMLSYIAKQPIVGQQIQGYIQTKFGNSTEVFNPIEVEYVFAKDIHGNVLADEEKGTWTWYRETHENSDVYEKIQITGDHTGTKDSYTPLPEDTNRRIYAMYRAAEAGIYTGEVTSEKLKSVEKASQVKPDKPLLVQVNGTSIQIALPKNYRKDGNTIPEVMVGYRKKGDTDIIWLEEKNTAWIKELEKYTTYEIFTKYQGTSEYKESEISDALVQETGNQAFPEPKLTIEAQNYLTPGVTIKAKYSGDGYDEGYFSVKRSDGTIIKEHVDGIILASRAARSNMSVMMSYTLTEEDIGYNIIIVYQAKNSAMRYEGFIEKNSGMVKKAIDDRGLQPQLSQIFMIKDRLLANIEDEYEYVLNDSADAITQDSPLWKKLKGNNGIYEFTGLKEGTTYYLHKRKSETPTTIPSKDIISAGMKPWKESTYTIGYDNVEKDYKGIETYTELSETFSLVEPKRLGYTFIGWSWQGNPTPLKNVEIVNASTGNRKYQANWQANEYILWFHANGGMDLMERKVAFDAKLGELPIPIHPDAQYEFVGWYDALTGGNQVTSDMTMPAKDMMLYAHWKSKKDSEDTVQNKKEEVNIGSNKHIETGDILKVEQYVWVMTISLIIIATLLVCKKKRNN